MKIPKISLVLASLLGSRAMGDIIWDLDPNMGYFHYQENDTLFFTHCGSFKGSKCNKKVDEIQEQ